MRQLLQYGLIGVISNGIGYIVYLFFTFLGISPKITMTIVYSVSALIGFFGNGQLTFNHKSNVFNAGIRYMLAQFFGYCINLAILVIMVDNFKYNHQLIQAIAIFIVAGFLFVACKYFVFRSFESLPWSTE